MLLHVRTSALGSANVRVNCVPAFSVESTALRLITALGSSEVQPQFTRFLNDPKTVLSAESEELNRALILTLARATHVTGRDPARDANIHRAAPLRPLPVGAHAKEVPFRESEPVALGSAPDQSKMESRGTVILTEEIPKDFLFMDFHLHMNKYVSY